jgi:hypothetical protein
VSKRSSAHPGRAARRRRDATQRFRGSGKGTNRVTMAASLVNRLASKTAKGLLNDSECWADGYARSATEILQADQLLLVQDVSGN